MTTKTISGTYSAGYLVNSSFSAVTVTSTGSVGGFGLVVGAAGVQVNDAGHLLAANGAAGISLLGASEGLTSHAGGYIRGGAAIPASGAGANGNAGGAGAYLKTYDTLAATGGDMVGGAGGAGLTGTFGGQGGVGGAGADFLAGGHVQNSGGYLFGGRGGAGGASTYSAGSPGGFGGNGGAGVAMGAYGVVVNSSGGIAGGYGGQGGPGGSGSYINVGGSGGAGLYLAQGGIVLAYGGFIEGGRGGPAGAGGAGGRGGDGVQMQAFGYVTNRALIVGGEGGTGADGLNQFYQQLGQGGAGVDLRSGGAVTNYGLVSGGTGGTGGAGQRPGAGGDGVFGDGAVVFNYGTIDGGGGGYSKTFKSFCGYGVELSGNSYVLNGRGVNSTAVIQGNGGHYSQGPNYNGVGVYGVNGSHLTVNNWATISGTDAISFHSTYDKLIAEGDSVLIGAVLGGGGTLELGAGAGTITGLDAIGDVTLTGFLGAASNTLFQNFGALEIAVGGSFATTATSTIASGRTVLDYGVLADAGTLTVAGSIGGGGTLTVEGRLVLQNKSSLTVATLLAQTKTSKITVGSNLVFAGLWDQTKGALTINANRSLDFTGTTDYLYGKVTNNGDLEMSGTGHLYIFAPLANNGALVVNGGTITLENSAVVTGSGDALITGGTLVAGSAFDQNVIFEGAGTLILDQSQAYGATVSGFSTVGANFLDLGDIGFVNANEATFSGTAAGGVLTVSDGTHTAHINLSGNYLSSSFVCASDGHGGVIIHDPPAAPPAPASTHAMVAAMAALGAAPAPAATAASEATRNLTPSLAAPHGASMALR